MGGAAGRRAGWSLYDLRVRAILYQVLLVAAVGLVAWFLIYNTAHNLESRKIASGFGFLKREAGFAIGETTLISYNAADTYLRALTVGVLNTFRVSVIGVIAATLLGTLIGLARLSRNWLLSRLAAGYVETLRNVPLLVQLFFWYTVISDNLPGPRHALAPLPGVFLSNRGIALPVVQAHPAHAWIAAALIVGMVAAWLLTRWAKRRQALTGQPFPTLSAGSALVLGLPLIVFLVAGAPLHLERPVLQGFNFSGGMTLTPEFAALLGGLTTYTAAFIAEIVRAGVLAVDRGQFEAAYALGLRPRRAMRLVILPQALRVIVPPMTSQFLNLTKNSSLAVAIGYPDLVSIANTSMNQTGQAIEGIAIIMAVYLTISLSISAFMNWYNKRIALKGATRS
ncbi:MAG TPA: amino acid ABC transporter permease [Burkholderiales bacterium]|nr:amino acid ABC transporter permease [Burkholderiales bacterium]